MNKPAMKSRHPHPFQQGVTLLEVLIAIVVLSFGLLGMLGMLMNGLKMTSSSHYRTIAAQQLTAMADMINANPSLIGTYANATTPSTHHRHSHLLHNWLQHRSTAANRLQALAG